MAELKYWVWLSTLTDLKPITRFRLLEDFQDPEGAYFADEKRLLKTAWLTDAERRLLSDKSLTRAEEILSKCREDSVSILTINDAAYPERLRNIYDPPVLLYIKGRLPAVDSEAAIALVGTRRATPYGFKLGRQLGFEISRCGGLVVTGLAAGVDSAAADGALRAGGGCIGVLGCAIDTVYPTNNVALYADVAEAGALVSEYPPGTLTQSRFFPERNRIMSGLSVGVVVVEAPEKSGALITASLALEQGREVFAVPGAADMPNSGGTNRIIREGAALVTCGWDVMVEFAERFPDKVSPPERDKVTLPDEESLPKPVETPSGGKNRARDESGEASGGFAKLRVRNDRKGIDKPNKRDYIDLKDRLRDLTENQLKIVAVMDESAKHVDDIIEAAGLPAPTVLSELTVLQIKGIVSQGKGKRFTLNIVGK